MREPRRIQSVDIVYWLFVNAVRKLQNLFTKCSSKTTHMLAAHGIHLLLVGDFIYCYVRVIFRGNLFESEYDFSQDVLNMV